MSDVKINPLVSVIVITFNQERYIEECILSILNQDYNNIEIIISDDGSTDNTQNILKKLKNDYTKKIFLNLSSKNQGITINSNLALSKTRGQYICFTGGDDVFNNYKISKQVEWMKNNPNCVMCGHDANIIDFKSKLTGEKFSDKVKLFSGSGPSKIIKNGPPFPSSSMIFKKSALPYYGFDENIKISSDWKLMLDLVYMNKCFGFINLQLINYRSHYSNVSHRHRAKIIRDQFRILYKFVFQYEKKYLYEWIQYFTKRFIKTLIK